jgi:hypothetical protein
LELSDRKLGMPRKTESDALAKKVGEILRECTASIVAEELPDDIKKLLERMRKDGSKPKKS